MRKCRTCGKEKELNYENFPPQQHNKEMFKKQCRDCNKEKQREYYQKNREKLLESKRVDYVENKEKYRERNRLKYLKFRERTLSWQKQYYKDNKERIEEYRKEYYQKNKDRLRREARERYYEDVEKTRAQRRVTNNRYSKTEKGRHNSLKHSYKRRYRLSKAENTITIGEWEDTVKYFGGLCAYCGDVPEDLHRDHVIPITKGGGNVLGNLVISCSTCNLSKGSKDLDEWYKEYEWFDEYRYQRLIEFIDVNKRKEDD